MLIKKNNLKPIRETLVIDDDFRIAVYTINNSIMDNCHGEIQANNSEVVKAWKNFLKTIDYDTQIV
tara:strand:- start:464 stop:661 length:198 start_codon:yes stop_codon:yes gene_type:complete